MGCGTYPAAKSSSSWIDGTSISLSPLTARALTEEEMVETGTTAPAFTLTADDGTQVSLSEFRGQKIVLYFYPKADTPGCTKEACALRDAWSDLKDEKIKVFGVSYDTPRSNHAFAEKFSLPFLLLSDSEKSLAKSVGANRFLIPVPKRISYLVGADGKILKAYPSVSPASHAEDVLRDFESLTKPQS